MGQIFNSTMKPAFSSKPNKTHPREGPWQRWLDRVKKNVYQVDETASIRAADEEETDEEI